MEAIAASSRIRRWRPLHLYALLEVLVAFLGCTIVFGLPVLGDWMRPVWQTLWNYQPTLLGLRFVISFLILLVPTTAMGLTLPVIIEDDVLVGGNTGIYEGAVIKATAVIAAGTVITGSTPVYDLPNGLETNLGDLQNQIADPADTFLKGTMLAISPVPMETLTR